MDAIRQEVLEEMVRNPYLFVDIPDNFYPDAHYYMKLNIDDDLGPDVTTLTTLYQAMEAKGDPRSEQVLKMIFAKQGKSLDQIAGARPKPTAPIANGAPGNPTGETPEATPAAAAPVRVPAGVK